METASAYLVALARRHAAIYLAHTQPQAIILMGSAAEGESDFFSDLDMSLYYDVLPADAQLEAARAQIGATEFRLLGPRTDRACIEDYFVNGVECQVVHITIAAWEADMARVRQELDVASPLQKALGGFLDCVPLHGAAHIAQWKATLGTYPDALARAMVQYYLQFFPLWYLQERFAVRDTALWVREMLVESSYHLLGILAGLNRLYYSMFQFKRMHRFIGKMGIAPPDLAARLESLLLAPPATAIPALEALVGETVALVEAHLPEVDTAAVRRRLGQRQPPWQPAPLITGHG